MCPQIKSPLLRNSIHTSYQYIYASTLARHPQPAEAEYRLRTDYRAVPGHPSKHGANTEAIWFRGDSRFTTWAYKFVIFEVSAKLGRHYWRNPPVQVGGDAWERIPDRFGADPAQHAESRELAGALRRAVTEALSERQRRVFVAIIVDGIPLDALAAELGSTRNAIYKRPRG